mgnify:CR=1 FL=1
MIAAALKLMSASSDMILDFRIEGEDCVKEAKVSLPYHTMPKASSKVQAEASRELQHKHKEKRAVKVTLYTTLQPLLQQQNKKQQATRNAGGRDPGIAKSTIL